MHLHMHTQTHQYHDSVWLRGRAKWKLNIYLKDYIYHLSSVFIDGFSALFMVRVWTKLCQSLPPFAAVIVNNTSSGLSEPAEQPDELRLMTQTMIYPLYNTAQCTASCHMCNNWLHSLIIVTDNTWKARVGSIFKKPRFAILSLVQ